MRGSLDWIARAKTTERQIEGYRRLRLHIERFRIIPVIDFDVRAGEQLEKLRQARIRVGTMDLKIAAIAIVLGATVLTRNVSDFGKVPDLLLEDWTL